MLNLVDRGLMILLLQPIKEDLHLSDTQLGLLTGVAFGVFYATLGVPIGRWADRGNRVTIASLAIGLWGLTVMSSVFVGNYFQLLCARIAAAVGESGCKPPTYSLVGDYFPEAGARTSAMAVYMMGSPLAALLSYVAGGWLNELYGWRLTFFIMGIPGLILALLFKLTVAEPRAAGADQSPERRIVPVRTVFTFLWRQRSLRHLAIALILLYTMSLGLGPWYAAFMMRSHGMQTGELGLWLGLIFSCGGALSVLLGGYLANKWFLGDEPGQMRLSAVAVTSLVPCFVAFLLVPGRYQALSALAPLMIGLYVFTGPTYALMQRLVPDDMRATMMSVVMFLANLIGMGTGPQIVGALSDLWAPVAGPDSLRYAMLTTSFVAFGAAYNFWRAARTIREDLGRTPHEQSFESQAENTHHSRQIA
jgi:MFS family permease